MSEKLPQTSHESEPYAHQEEIQYPNGQAAYRFATMGDRVPLGAGAEYTEARLGPDPSRMAIIHTASGDKYGVASNWVIKVDSDGRNPVAYDVGDKIQAGMDITIGQPCNIPEVDGSNASYVDKVTLRGKIYSRQPGSYEQIDTPDPFEAFSKIMELAREQKDKNTRSLGSVATRH